MRPGVPLPIVKGRDDREAHPGARTGSLGALGQWAGIGPHGANGDPRLHREMARCYHSPVTRKVLNALLVALTLIGLSAGPAASIAAMGMPPGTASMGMMSDVDCPDAANMAVDETEMPCCGAPVGGAACPLMSICMLASAQLLVDAPTIPGPVGELIALTWADARVTSLAHRPPPRPPKA